MKSYTSKELHQMTVPDLKLLIRHHNIRNYSKMREQQLVNAKNLCQTSKIKKATLPSHNAFASASHHDRSSPQYCNADILVHMNNV